MSISSANRTPFFAPLSSTSNCKPVSAPAESVERTAGPQPQNGLWQKLLSDSFEQGPSKLGGALGSGKMEQLPQVLGELTQLMNALETMLQGGQGGVPAEGPQDLASQGVLASNAAPTAQSPAPAPSKSISPDNPTPSTRSSDAGPGFGAPSAGSTEQVNPSEPWLAKNNVGSPYNSNMQLIEPSQKSQFKYTNTFVNNTNQPQTITLWNKTGENGGPNDGQHFDKSTPKTFTLQPGQSQLVAFDSNSSVAWCASKDGSAKPGANFGQTWGEATFANAGTGWSGYDTSQISPAGHQGNMSIKNEATGHTVTEANAWQTPSDNPAGRDVGVPAGPLNLTTTFS
ncbi:hypothetical protein [Vitiosangium sp. GDMCC 1.1324]|uniref:hypothetical protein n=1 Tax=Vitiosangium sp. (strain GDMCC 1.1324) TaxID=2138576 RepID=UPI000D3A5741|nr:hypothetical protein [Vitiosangium sp. GDMCC 1.1324]PTL82026.1 hypothetical protein DAT35_19635 [Vitiosangium sp. GDMCC 1.1324]